MEWTLTIADAQQSNFREGGKENEDTGGLFPEDRYGGDAV